MVTPHSSVRVLFPGEVVCAVKGQRLQTLLGSCVSVVMTDRRRTVGVMSHIVHAGSHCGGTCIAGQKETAWGGPAMDLMHAMLIQHGYQPHLCEAWVYGGGNMFPGQPVRRSVGNVNIEWVTQRLLGAGICITHVDVGGNGYRKLDWTVGDQDLQVQLVTMDAWRGASNGAMEKSW